MKKLEEVKSKLTNNKRRNEDISNNNDDTKKQCVLENWSSSRIVTQKKLDVAIVRFVIENVQPLAVVKSSAFIDLVKMELPSSLRIMCKKTLREKLCQSYFNMKTALENQLTEIETISTTADLWSKAKKLIQLFYFYINILVFINACFVLFYILLYLRKKFFIEAI